MLKSLWLSESQEVNLIVIALVVKKYKIFRLFTLAGAEQLFNGKGNLML